MQARLFNVWMAVNSSYWFIPSAMALLAIILGIFMVWLDTRIGVNWLNEQVGWFQSIKPAGARSVLSAIATSMLTVAGTVFSITIAAITFASGQFGPRLLTNFMSDRGNTVTLGTFVATSVYSLVVLRTIRAEEGGGGFVPQVAVTVAILLAFCSIAVLIYFINHVPRTIHINQVVAQIGRQLIGSVDDRFPRSIGAPARPPAERSEPIQPPPESIGPSQSILAGETGYIQTIEEGDLLDAASERELVLRLHYRPGDFVAAGRPLLEAWPLDRLDDEVCAELRQAIIIGDERTPYGDLHFLIEELVEVASRALSTGVNDPVTAITCMDWLGAGLSEIASRTLPDPVRRSKDGKARVIAFPDRFETLIDLSLGRLRHYAAGDPTAAMHLLKTIGLVASSCTSDERVRLLDQERQRLARLAEERLTGPSLHVVDRANSKLATLLAHGPGQIDEREVAWLGGSA